MNVQEYQVSSARWWDYKRRNMILEHPPTTPSARLTRKIAAKQLDKSPTSSAKIRTPVFLLFAMVLISQTLTCAKAQVELGYRDLLYPDRLIYAAPEQSHDEPDPLERMRRITRRAMITVDGKDQGRFLTVFRASKHGHVQFGFPTSESRSTGSLEILDVSDMSSRCCSSGIRMVAARHVCSKLYVTLDSYRRIRACQISDSGMVTPLHSQTHCIEGERLHICTKSPYFYLDPVERFQYGEQMTSSDASQNKYKIRFERKRQPNARHTNVYYATVASPTWEVKVRPQNGVLQRATLDAVQHMWERSLHVLFSKTITNYEKRRLKRNFLERSPCQIDPVTVRDFLIENASATLFKRLIDASWRSSDFAGTLASSVAWSNMSDVQKEVFVLIVVRVVKHVLRDSLLDVTNLHCLSRSQWGRLSRMTKLIILERRLTITWVQRRTEGRSFILTTMNKWLDSKLTTFLIREDG